MLRTRCAWPRGASRDELGKLKWLSMGCFLDPVQEVHEELLGAVVKYLPAKAGPPGRTLRTYWWGPAGRLEEWKMVKTVEEGKIISAGEPPCSPLGSRRPV